MCRRFFGIHQSRRFLSPFEIREVYREGSAVRVDLREAGVDRPFFWFWAEDVAAAAAVVRLLASKRSIEFDEGFSERLPNSSGQPRRTWLPVLPLTLTLLVAALLIWFARSRYEAQTPASVKAPAQPPSTGQARLQPSRADIVQARREVDRFDSETSALEMEFARSFESLQKGGLSQQDFINRLDDSLVPQWEAIQRKLTSNPLPIGSAAAGVREDLVTSSINWERALRIYGAGLRVHDANVVLLSFEYLKHADDARRRADERIRELEDTRRNVTP
jgi:hypothetical protein